MEAIYNYYLNSTGVSIDTRTINGGELFFCLKGDRFNGNKFAEKAMELGASCIIVDDKDYYKSNSKMILVDDSLKTLQELSLFHRKQLEIPIIGITGTNGKTTTKELVSTVLSAHMKCVSTKGNFNNHIGVPLTLLSMDEDDEIAVVEMGANHVGEIEDLCELVIPNYGIITNVGKAHLEGFGSFENIIETKTALYTSVRESKGTLFINADDEILLEKAPDIKLIKYGCNSNAEYIVSRVEGEPYLQFKWKEHHITTKLFGDYNIHNAAAAIAIGDTFNVPIHKIIKALKEYTPTNNRSQFEKGKNNRLILDAYNSNPESLNMALQSFHESVSIKKTVILGDMLELGQFEKDEHVIILKLLNTLGFGENYLVGDAFYKLKDQYPQFTFFQNTTIAKSFFEKKAMKGYTILLKGSRGIKLEILKEVLL